MCRLRREGWWKAGLALLLAAGCCAGLARPSAAEETAADDEYSESEREHWAFLPRVLAEPPTFASPADRAWARSPVDAFILEQLQARRLSPAPPADRPTLARRLAFDLTGLPLEPAELDRYLADQQPGAYERLVDRLLASPHYGEHWAQHWLDVVRYAETEGFEYDAHRPGAWRYRDWVIDALNRDLPYDKFLRLQLAGDELAPNDHQALIAAGFHRLGPVRRNAGNTEVSFSRNEVLTERTNIIGVALLGVTVGCARCHDHMFDPFRQRDYYQLSAFMAASFERDLVLASEEEQARWQKITDRVTAEVKQIREELKEVPVDQRVPLEAKLAAAEARLPAPLPTISTIRNDPAERTTIHVLTRGEVERPGRQVGPRALGVLLPAGSAELPAEMARPRTRLAEWITDPAHPLTARVIVNRLWHYHFGQGLVDTPNDFGLNGSTPTHPELLDWLAERLIAEQWSLKRMHRLLVTSNAYRQSGAHPQAEQARRIDPNNRRLWHFARRRLSAEELRDAMLAVSGQLNRQRGGESVMVPVDPESVALLYKPSQWAVTPDATQHDRRSIYLIAKRNLKLPMLEVFDQPDLQTSCAVRIGSTHAPQSLELLNGPLANRLAAALAARLAREAGEDPASQAELGFRLVAGRAPNEPERRLAAEFLRHGSLPEFALALLNLNAFLYVE